MRRGGAGGGAAAAAGIVAWDGFQIATGADPKFLGIGLLVPLTLLSLPVAGLLYVVGSVLGSAGKSEFA